MPIEILLVEDNPGDVRLTIEALRDAKVSNHLTVAPDGVEALAMVRGTPPYKEAGHFDLILLDLNLPKKNGARTSGRPQERPQAQTYSGGHPHDPRKAEDGYPQDLRPSCQLLHHEAGRVRPIHACGQVDRGFLAVCGDPPRRQDP